MRSTSVLFILYNRTTKVEDVGREIMEQIINTLLVSCIPAIITGVITYLTAGKKAKSEIVALQESNKHEIEKLMKQHEVDIESLKEKNQLEMEKSNQEHRHKIEIMQLEHKNALESNEKQQSDAAMFGVMEDVMRNPQKLNWILELANNPLLNDKK